MRVPRARVCLFPLSALSFSYFIFSKAFTSQSVAQSTIPDVQSMVPWVSGMHKSAEELLHFPLKNLMATADNLLTLLCRTDQLSAVREILQSFKDDPEAEERYRTERAAVVKEVRSVSPEFIIYLLHLGRSPPHLSTLMIAQLGTANYAMIIQTNWNHCESRGEKRKNLTFSVSHRIDGTPRQY